MNFPLLMESLKIVPGLSNTQCDAGASSDRVNIAGYQGVAVLVVQRQGGANDNTVTFHKATTDGTTTEDTTNAIANFWSMEDVTVGTTADTWTKETAVASGATITTSATGSGTSYYLIELDPAEFPDTTSQDYKFLEVVVGSAGHASNFIDVIFLLYQPRYAGATMPSAQA
jgi:hypothetical protein